MDFLFDGLSGAQQVLLVVALLVACGFEFVNGFHDTANAVATVIYTKSLRPWYAVVLSGVCNFLGVFMGGIAVAVSIIKLLPSELLIASGPGASMSMVMALLLAAVLWNLGTWYLGLPASSSHTLIGAILGVGLAHSLTPGHEFGSGVNWSKAGEVFLSLLVSPLLGFSLAGVLLWLSRRLLAHPELHRPPHGEEPPPWPVRALLVGTCTGVSFAHGSNDGQKGVGLIMLILIGLVPGSFAMDTGAGPERLQRSAQAAARMEQVLEEAGVVDVKLRLSAAARALVGVDKEVKDVTDHLEWLREKLSNRQDVASLTREERWEVRKRMLVVDSALDSLMKRRAEVKLTDAQKAELKKLLVELRNVTDYAPNWVLVAVALSLGIGTMIGWQRIVVTVGEKIGKSHLTYAQGASAELVAMSTIGMAALLGLPVSTTHVLSSGIAGTMVVQGSGVQKSTVTKIAMAWVFTLPASALMSAVLFLVLRWLFT